MTHKPKLHASQERSLAMTFRMQQSLAILQMPQEELRAFIQEEIDKNPLLKERPKFKKNIPLPDIASSDSIYEKIQEQIRESFPEKENREIAEKFFYSLDEKGFLSTDIKQIAEELNLPIAKITTVLSVMQSFEPPGIFARNLQESLLLQLRAIGEEKSPTFTLVQDHFSDLLHHRYSLLKKKRPLLDLPEAIEKLALLQLRPLNDLKKEIARPVIVDLAIEKTEGGWSVKTIEEEIPSFTFNSDYDEIKTRDPVEKEILQMWRSQGKWLFHALNRRRKLILQIAIRLTKFQSQYLSLKGKLNPITTQQIAQEIGVHESTIFRAISGKFAETPRGIIPLKSLLTRAPEKEEVKQLILELIETEDRSKPLTDENLAEEIKQRGLKIARRTLSKYRKELNIRDAKSRKLF